MQILIKCLKGGSTVADVTPETQILEVKQKVEKDLKIPVAQQTLVLLGSPLQDDRKISDYPKIKENTKIYVVIKKADSLPTALSKFLRKYYNEDQTKLIVDAFMKDFHHKVNNMSLDDLERYAIENMNAEGTS